MKKSAQTVIREGACYTIAAANGRVLEVADFNTENGASIRLWSYEGQPWQQWIFEEAAEGQYRIKNRFTGKVNGLKDQWANRKLYHYYRCPQCRQKLRVPRGRGRIQISCPRCGTQFIKKS